MKFDEIVILTVISLMMLCSIYYIYRYCFYERNTPLKSCVSRRVRVSPPVTIGLNPVGIIHDISHTRVTPKDIETGFL